MLETPDQIQTPIHVESPTPDLPAQSPEPQTPTPGDSEQDEVALTAEISELWRLHADYKGSIKSQTEDLRGLRAELGKRLAEMKQVLARPGRNGQWSGWLKERKIPRATADRLVGKYERSLNPDGNCLTESISEPTEEEIQTLLDKLSPKLRRVLRTQSGIYRFIDLLTSSFALKRKGTEEGFIVLKPYTHTEGEQSVREESQHEPVESPVEPVPVVADAPAECDGQSMEIS